MAYLQIKLLDDLIGLKDRRIAGLHRTVRKWKNPPVQHVMFDQDGMNGMIFKNIHFTSLPNEANFYNCIFENCNINFGMPDDKHPHGRFYTCSFNNCNMGGDARRISFSRSTFHDCDFSTPDGNMENWDGEGMLRLYPENLLDVMTRRGQADYSYFIKRGAYLYNVCRKHAIEYSSEGCVECRLSVSFLKQKRRDERATKAKQEEK
jgi:hypothetical protein